MIVAGIICCVLICIWLIFYQLSFCMSICLSDKMADRLGFFSVHPSVYLFCFSVYLIVCFPHMITLTLIIFRLSNRYRTVFDLLVGQGRILLSVEMSRSLTETAWRLNLQLCYSRIYYCFANMSWILPINYIQFFIIWFIHRDQKQSHNDN